MLKKEGSDPFTSSAASGSPAINLTAGQRIVLNSAAPSSNFISDSAATLRPSAGYVFTLGTSGDGIVTINGALSYIYCYPLATTTLNCGFFRASQAEGGVSLRFGYGRTVSTGAAATDAYTHTSGFSRHIHQTVNFTPASGSGSFASHEINPTINGVSSGSATMLAVAPVVTALTGGTVNLLDMGTTTTDFNTGYTSKFKVDTNGKVTLPTAAGAPTVGTATLVGGTVTVSTTAVTASSKIFVTCNTPGGTQGFLSVPTASIVAATSFVINSSNGADTSTVNWWFVN